MAGREAVVEDVGGGGGGGGCGRVVGGTYSNNGRIYNLLESLSPQGKQRAACRGNYLQLNDAFSAPAGDL